MTEKEHLKWKKKGAHGNGVKMYDGVFEGFWWNYKYECVKILEVLNVERYQMYLGSINEELCALVKYSFISN